MPSIAASTNSVAANAAATTSTTSAKMENKTPAQASALDIPESLKSVLTIVEKKVRNLEKRKSKLDGYREELARGRPLDAEQKLAVARYDEVVQNLELARELTKQFEKIALEASKEEKKRRKREIFEKQQHELTRFKELLTTKAALECVVRPESQDDFLNGTRGAIHLEEADLVKLQAFHTLTSLDRPDFPGGFVEAVTGAATHLQLLLEGRNKEVVGSTYRELKDLIGRVAKCGYFDWKAEAPQEEVPDVPVNPVVETPAIQEGPVFETANGEATVPVEAVPAPVIAPAPVPPVVTLPAGPTSYFPVELNTDFNFIQESLIDCKPPIPAPTTAPIPVGAVPPVSLSSMDSAVVMVHAQVPHGHPHPHLAYPFIPGAPGASLFHPAPHNPLSGVPQPMIQQQQPQPNEAPAPIKEDMSGLESHPVPEASQQRTSQQSSQQQPPPPQQPPPQQAPPQQPQQQTQERPTSSPWAEEVDEDAQTYQQQQQQHRNESNTWTNSNYRSNDQDYGSRPRGGYRGRGGQRGGNRGGSSGPGSYYNSRGGGSGGYGSGEQRNNYFNSGGSHSNNGTYRGRGGSGSYPPRNGGGYRGDRGGPSRGGPSRGASRGVYERNN